MRQKIITMKKIFGLALVALSMMTIASCTTVAPMAATGNNVGKKCGVAEETRILGIYPFAGDHGIDKAVKNGGIKKISHVDVQTYNLLGILKTTTTKVYGE